MLFFENFVVISDVLINIKLPREIRFKNKQECLNGSEECTEGKSDYDARKAVKIKISC